MELLETRFYSLAEIHEITGKRIKRDVTHLLDLWGYKYQWSDRQGVTITQCPEGLSRFAELMRRHLHINSQIKPYPFGCFLLNHRFASLLSEKGSSGRITLFSSGNPDKWPCRFRLPTVSSDICLILHLFGFFSFLRRGLVMCGL